jgi:hypothetical protein
MMNKLFGLLSVAALLFALSGTMSAQESSGKKQARWEGNIIRVSSEQSTLDVRQVGGTIEKIIHYDSATKWTSQYHGSKEVNNIDASQVKEGDRVICTGTFDDKGEFRATQISKRLSHSPSK